MSGWGRSAQGAAGPAASREASSTTNRAGFLRRRRPDSGRRTAISTRCSRRATSRAVRPLNPGDAGADLHGGRLGRMKRTGGLVNIRPGKGVGRGAVAAALGGGRLFGAGSTCSRRSRGSPGPAVGPVAVLLPPPRKRDRGDAGGDGAAGDENLLAVLRRAGAAVPRQLKRIPFRRRMSMGSIVPVLEKGTWTKPTTGATTPPSR